MNGVLVKFLRLAAGAVMPAYAREGDAGMDVCAVEEVSIAPGERRLVRTGWAMELPRGTEAQVRPRSGLAFKHGVTVLNAPGTIDSGYRGEICVLLVNLGDSTFRITPGMRIAQLVIAPVLAVRAVEADGLSGSERGGGGFGSTGTQPISNHKQE